jgi:hypothetical protein
LDESYESALAKDHRLLYDAIGQACVLITTDSPTELNRIAATAFADAFRMLGKSEREAQRERSMS